MIQERYLGVVLLAGGVGSRMGSPTPKQFLELKNKRISHYSFDLFNSMNEVLEIVVVCHPEYHHLFEASNKRIRIAFASPGERRQDSVYNGLQAITSSSLICVHDSVRPFITIPMVRSVASAAKEYGAAAVGVSVKFTIKETDVQHFVAQTHDRSRLWEIQTPQIIQKPILERGFEHALKNKLTVTDDVSLVELLKLPVKLVEGTYTNLKITTQDDLAYSEYLLNRMSNDGSIQL